MEKQKLEGIFIPMVTSFNDDESINHAGCKEVVDFLIDNGVSGVIPSGSTGEMSAMDKEEQMSVNETVIKHVNGRIKVFAGTGACTTKETIEMSVAAEKAGADGVMVVPPWYMGPNELEVYHHYKALREAISIPIMMYHNPYYSTVLMSDEFMAKLYNDGLVDAVKERQADVYRQQDLRALTDEYFGIFYGYDVCPVESLSCWADGWVCGTGNLFPAENTMVYNLAKAQKMEEAKKYHMEKIRPYLPLFTKQTAAGYPSPWLSVIKEGLKLRGVNAGVARKPVLGVPDDVMANLKETLKKYGHL